MLQSGKVLVKENGWAVLEIIRPSACAGCGMCKPSSNAKRVRAICEKDCTPGDIVNVEMKDGDVLKAATAAYIVPLLGFIAGIIVGNAMSRYFAMPDKADAFGAAGGFLFLGMTYLAVRKYDMGLDKKKFSPVVTGLSDPGEIACHIKKTTA